MQRRIRYFPCIFPFLGIIFGIIFAFVSIYGLDVTWHFVGNPSENITRIIGFVEGHHLFVETETGNVYSFEYNNHITGNDFLPTPIEWKKEEKQNPQITPERKPYLKFISLPLLIPVKQLYEMEFQQQDGEFLVKFALAEDGNLWMWNYGRDSSPRIYYICIPSIFLFYGIILALVINAGLFLWKIIKYR